jgi:hypothetical protein
MRFIKKVVILALVAAGLYFIYKYAFAPFIETGKSRVGTFYGTIEVPVPK